MRNWVRTGSNDPATAVTSASGPCERSSEPARRQGEPDRLPSGRRVPRAPAPPPLPPRGAVLPTDDRWSQPPSGYGDEAWHRPGSHRLGPPRGHTNGYDHRRADDAAWAGHRSRHVAGSRRARPGPPPAAPLYPPPPRPRPPAERQSSRHGRRKRRVPIWAFVVLLLGVVAVAVGMKVVPTPVTEGRSPMAEDAPTPEPSPTLEPLPFRSAEVTLAGVDTKGSSVGPCWTSAPARSSAPRTWTSRPPPCR